MTFDLRKFERVWGKAWERPTFDGECLWYDNSTCMWAVKHDYLRNETAAAIIRDWAVRWLMEHHANAIFAEGDEWSIAFMYWGDSDRDIFGRSTDRTEALYLACCKALGIEP